MKVMRKRLNGVYRADTGFSGPTRRYVMIVALLVGLASVPTLAAITAGSNELADGRTDTMDIPFLPPVSSGPIRSGAGSAPSERPHSPVSPSEQPSPRPTRLPSPSHADKKAKPFPSRTPSRTPPRPRHEEPQGLGFEPLPGMPR